MMPESVSRRVELIAGILSMVVCLGALVWAFASDVRDRSPGSIEVHDGPDIVLDDVIGVDGVRDLTPGKVGFLALVAISGLSVGVGAFVHVRKSRGTGSAGAWLGSVVLLGCAIATIRTLGMPLLFSSLLGLIAGLAGSIASAPSGVSPTATRPR